MNEFTGRTDAMSDVLELVRPVPAAEAVSDQDHGGVIRHVGIEGRHGHPLEWLRLTTQFLADEAQSKTGDRHNDRAADRNPFYSGRPRMGRKKQQQSWLAEWIKRPRHRACPDSYSQRSRAQMDTG